MGSKARWLLVLLPVAFLSAVLVLAHRRDPEFWRSPVGLYRSAQEAAERGELTVAPPGGEILAAGPRPPGFRHLFGLALPEGGAA